MFNYEDNIILGWHHPTYDGNYAYLYIDGELKATSGKWSIHENGFELYGSTIGTSWNTYFDGLNDEVSIMDTTLSSDHLSYSTFR